MKKLFLSLVVCVVLHQHASAQAPDNTDGRLYLTCKVWGYLKYFSQQKCDIKWDTLLRTTIEEVLAAPDNATFNASILGMCNKVGNNSFRDDAPALPDTNLNVNSGWTADPSFSEPVMAFLDTFTAHIYPDEATCLVKINDYSNPNYISFIDFRQDSIRSTGGYTIETNRLLTLFYHWNVINYYFPFKGIMDQSWDTTLSEFIPRIRAATTSPTFLQTFLKYQTKINDTHGFTTISPVTGSYAPKVQFIRIGEQCVVRKSEVDGMSPGDVVLAVNGVAIKHLEDSLAESIPASTPASLYRDIYDLLSFGAGNSTITYTLLDSNNTTISVNATRNLAGSSWYAWSRDPGVSSSYFFTTCGYGYVNMGMLESQEVPDMYDMFQNAPAIIFDLRNYPNGTLWDLGYYFFQSPIISARWFRPSMLLSGWYDRANDQFNLGTWTNPNAYKGKIYILVNEETQSQAEYTCQYLSHAPTAKVIGSQTAGADGNISFIDLPGGIRTYFTSLGWYYGDWYQQQRNGVKIDSVVVPTSAGLRAGKDEVLEAALDCLIADVDDARVATAELSVFPNPTKGVTTVHAEAVQHVTLSNALGVQVLELDLPPLAVFNINLSTLPAGVYLAKFTTPDGISTSRLIVKE